MKQITVTPEECYLIDWVLTMHSFDNSLAGLLQSDLMYGLRKKVSPMIVRDSMNMVSFTEEELSWLLILIPITFRFYKEDVGFSLKTKLLSLFVPPKLDLSLEVRDGDSNTSKNETTNSPESSTAA